MTTGFSPKEFFSFVFSEELQAQRKILPEGSLSLPNRQQQVKKTGRKKYRRKPTYCRQSGVVGGPVIISQKDLVARGLPMSIFCERVVRGFRSTKVLFGRDNCDF